MQKDAAALVSDVCRRLDRENIVHQIDERSRDMPDVERRRLGDRILQAVERWGPRYGGIILQRTAESADEDGGRSPSMDIFLFPWELYKTSLLALDHLIGNSCPCSLRGENHPAVSVTPDPLFSSRDCYLLCALPRKNMTTEFSSHHILIRADVIKRIAAETCIRGYITSPVTRDFVIDCVDTDESLGWREPPDNRPDFVEDMKFEDITVPFEDSDSAETLVGKYIEWLRQESDERRKVGIADKGMNLVRRLGTSDGLFVITTRDAEKHARAYVYVPFVENSDSILLLCNAMRKKRSRETLNSHDLDEALRCRCGKNTFDHDGYFDSLHPYTVTVPYYRWVTVMTTGECKDSHILIKDQRMLPPERISKLLDRCDCPHDLIKDRSAVMSLFDSKE